MGRRNLPEALSGSPYPEVPYPVLVMFDGPPPSVRRDMRTVDPVHPLKGESDSPFLIEGAAGILDQLSLASEEKGKGQGNPTRLAFISDSVNSVTGSYGIIVRRSLAGGRFSRPLAELIAPSGEYDDQAKNEANRLGWSAAHRRLIVLVHRELREPHPRPAAFAVVRDDEAEDTYLYVARLLITPFEVSQWLDPEFDTPSGSAIQ
jgi:hypothetical protein